LEKNFPKAAKGSKAWIDEASLEAPCCNKSNNLLAT